MVMSGLIGIVSSILKTLEDRFSILVSILLHFVAVAFLACCFMVYNNWGFLIFNWHFWLEFYSDLSLCMALSLLGYKS